MIWMRMDGGCGSSHFSFSGASISNSFWPPFAACWGITAQPLSPLCFADFFWIIFLNLFSKYISLTFSLFLYRTFTTVDIVNTDSHAQSRHVYLLHVYTSGAVLEKRNGVVGRRLAVFQEHRISHNTIPKLLHPSIRVPVRRQQEGENQRARIKLHVQG